MVKTRSRMILVSAAVAIGSSSVVLLAQTLGLSAIHLSPATQATSRARDLSAIKVEPAENNPEATNASAPALSSLVNTVNSLKQIHTDSFDTNIPPAARPLLTTLKHQLRDLIIEVLNSEGADASAQQVEARAIVDLKNTGVTVKEDGCVFIDKNYVDSGYDYGQIYSITVIRPPPVCLDMIAVTTTIGVCCGEDTSLYLFQRKDSEWNLVLSDEVNDYQLVSGARALFEFDVSWPDDNGRFFVVATSVNPWCSSGWQRITYRVLRPGPSPDEPRVLLSRTQTIWLCDEPPYRLYVSGSGFTLSFHDEHYLDLQNNGEDVSTDDPKGMRIISYSVAGDSVKRKH